MENNNVLHATSDEQLEAAKKIRDHLIKEGEPRLLAIFNAGKIIALSEIPSGIEPPIMENNNRQGCRWTKASERLPEVSGDYHCKVVFPKILSGKYIYSFNYDTKKFCDEVGTLHTNSVAWLDESIEPCATSSENYWKKRCEAAEYLISPDAYGMLPQAYKTWRTLKNNEPEPPSEQLKNNPTEE